MLTLGQHREILESPGANSLATSSRDYGRKSTSAQNSGSTCATTLSIPTNKGKKVSPLFFRPFWICPKFQ
jgi:hypothetical protein